MKKIIILVIFLGFTSVQAQKVNFGIKLAFNRTSLHSNNIDFNKYLKGKMGYEGGVMAEYMFNNHFGLASEIKYAKAGDLFEIKGLIRYIINISYVQIPILARYYFNKNFSLEIGPQIGFLTSADYGVEINNSGDVNDYYGFLTSVLKNNDYGLNFGFGYKIKEGLFLNLRYTIGLYNIEKDKNSNTNNNSLQFGIGYYFK